MDDELLEFNFTMSRFETGNDLTSHYSFMCRLSVLLQCRRRWFPGDGAHLWNAVILVLLSTGRAALKFPPVYCYQQVTIFHVTSPCRHPKDGCFCHQGIFISPPGPQLLVIIRKAQ